MFDGQLEYESGYSRHLAAWQSATLRQMARTLPLSLKRAVTLAWPADPRAALVVLAAPKPGTNGHSPGTKLDRGPLPAPRHDAAAAHGTSRREEA
ncbi:hypothetical protein [Yinghuangia seranimata]|uniref:hypothetical protein n=1 Tax=Yinghuangia seranimata TaxID=408067 RepID=UPI00248CF574|nr:hypothetical protein [Yinghuangia seranimata]MDI2130534.1 hypothetical protein [Yinghuangia seranimata]